MDVGVKQAKTDLSKLILEVQQGKRVFLMNRGKRTVELIPVTLETQPAKERRGLGIFKDKIRFPPGWDTPEAQSQSTDEVLQLMGINDLAVNNLDIND